MTEEYNYLYYGTKCSSVEIRRFLLHTFEMSEKAEAGRRRKTPVCIWGSHGVGKTELVESVAAELGWDLAYVAPAQFEEMGDLVGMPRVAKEQGRYTTKLAPPDWVPRGEGPGILLLDDVNRADDRILRGIMQLLQNFELVSWKMPPRWQIVLTANPDGGDYSVTPMDNAMLTRMYHVTMEFDVRVWAAWAERNGVDPRGIGFVLMYPEIVAGERTTPRSLVQFFNAISAIEDLRAETELVRMAGDACLDPNTVASFLGYVDKNLHEMVTPEEILDASEFKELESRIAEQVDGSVKRMDMLSIICTRLTVFIIAHDTDLEGGRAGNLERFLKMALLPPDLRLTTAQTLMKVKHPAVRRIMAKPEMGKLILGKM